MDVFFETASGSEFCIELGYWDTVLEIKQKIEKYQRIPVSMQTLCFQGKILQDDLDIEQCVILHNSRLQIFVDPNGRNSNHSKDQVLQKGQSQVPSNSVEEIVNIQDTSVNVRSNKKVSKRTKVESNTNNKDDKVLFQTEQHPPSKSVKEIVNAQDSPWKTVEVRKIHMAWRNNDEVLQTEKSPPSNSKEDIINGHQNSTVMVQVPQPEQSPPSNSVKEINNNQDLPMISQSNMIVRKQIIRVLVLPYSGESKAAMNIRVLVNTKDHVKILRHELLQSRLRGHLNPQDGYFFEHEERILNEDKSFQWNSVGHNDTVEIVLDPWLY